ncbi:hypothetical protein EDD36DRAFT_430282 [Exophiala viscosa]|uniref:Uncharacterized protein n=1 Tax=Exophiala viscosa TaxID=2486360 RepID=A0AAN6E5E2_9EURO|nr:hypothetical protein EDD36DRAFT_430282 [Exophiala viscosa]
MHRFRSVFVKSLLVWSACPGPALFSLGLLFIGHHHALWSRISPSRRLQGRAKERAWRAADGRPQRDPPLVTLVPTSIHNPSY